MNSGEGYNTACLHLHIPSQRHIYLQWLLSLRDYCDVGSLTHINILAVHQYFTVNPTKSTLEKELWYDMGWISDLRLPFPLCIWSKTSQNDQYARILYNNNYGTDMTTATGHIMTYTQLINIKKLHNDGIVNSDHYYMFPALEKFVDTLKVMLEDLSNKIPRIDIAVSKDSIMQA